MQIQLGRTILYSIDKGFKLKIRDSCGEGKYKRTRILEVLADEVNIPRETFIQKFTELKQKYPDVPFRLREREGFLILTRKGGLPLYYSPFFKKIFVPKSYLTKKTKELRKGLPYRLKTLEIPFKLK